MVTLISGRFRFVRIEIENIRTAQPAGLDRFAFEHGGNCGITLDVDADAQRNQNGKYDDVGISRHGGTPPVATYLPRLRESVLSFVGAMIETTAFQGKAFLCETQAGERYKTDRRLKHKNETSQRDKSNSRSFATAIDESFLGWEQSACASVGHPKRHLHRHEIVIYLM